MEFDKNRVGQVGKKLFFTLDAGVSFDEKRFTRDAHTDLLVESERKQLESEDNRFDEIFGLSAETEVDESSDKIPTGIITTPTELSQSNEALLARHKTKLSSEFTDSIESIYSEPNK